MPEPELAERLRSANFGMRIASRIFDLLCAGIGFFLLLPLFFLVAAAIKLDDGGPVFYKQPRVGKNFRLFRIFKFRSMVVGADRSGLLTAPGDCRLTRVGRFVRKYKLDELPQLLNVLKGDMQLVGARPEVERYVQAFRSLYSVILQQRPGITDPASLAFRHEDQILSPDRMEEHYLNQVLPKKLELSLAYQQRRTPFSDIQILLRTILEITIRDTRSSTGNQVISKEARFSNSKIPGPSRSFAHLMILEIPEPLAAEVKANSAPINVWSNEDQVSPESWTAEQVLQWAFETYRNGVAIASGFGAEGIVTIDIAAQINPHPAVFTLDTGYLFPETLALIEKVERRYGIRVHRIASSVTPAAQAELYQPALWSRNPDLCCRIRKVEPLRRKLAGLRAWVTAIRQDQTLARQNARKIEWDSRFQLVKINPLADWTSEMVWSYIRTHRLDYNPLHDQGYPSIGCTHCTRPIKAGESPRAGRWSGLAKTECGIHDRQSELSSSPSLPISCQ
jgi:phosphoadenosine phosphosulfate reductase